MFTTIAYWNDWFLGMLYIVDQKKYPVQTLLWSMQNSLEFMKQSSANALEYAEMAANAPTDSGRMALTVLVVLPILLAYPFFQKYFEKGVMLGSVKGGPYRNKIWNDRVFQAGKCVDRINFQGGTL